MSTLSALKEKLFAVPVLVLAVFPALLFFSSCEQPAAGLGTKVDLTAPVIQINSELGPAPGSYVTGETRLYINASDDSGIEKVQVTYTYSLADENNQLIVQDPVKVSAKLDGETGLYYVDIDTTGMADGSLTMAISATDGSGKETTSDKLIYTVKNAPPVIEFQIPRPQVTNNTLNSGAANHQVVINSFISGMFQDLAGVAPGYPQIRFWADTSGATPPPTHDSGNAGYGAVTANDGSDDGWIPVDQGLVVSEQGERGNAFRYYLRNHRANGTYPGDAEPIDQISIGSYSLQIRAKDIMGKEVQWPQDAYDGTKDRLSLEIYAPNTLPAVELSTTPDNLYQRTDFTVTATAEPRGDVDTDIISLSIEVTGRQKGGSGTGPVTLAKWGGYTHNPSLPFNVIAGKSYYRVNAADVAVEAANEAAVPNGAYYVTFGDGSYTFTARTSSNTNAANHNEANIYIDTQPPAVSVNSVTPYYSQDNPGLTAGVDSPNTDVHPPAISADSYRRWTVNSTVKIQVSSTDNRGNALDENGNMKFKYLLSKTNDITETDYTVWLAGNSGKTFGDYLYQRADAVLFDATKAVSTPPNASGQYDGASYPAVNVSGADGAYELNLKTHEWEGGGDYRVWFYIVSQDNAGNISYDKILLNVNQATDNPTVNFTTINNDGTSFVDENDPFRITLSDDDGLDPGAVEYRFSKDGGATWSHAEAASWVPFPAFTGADGLSQDGRSIEISSLDLQKIYKDLTGNEYNLAPAHPDPKSIENILGDESVDKKIEIRAKDKLDTKIYNHTSGGDGVKTNTVQSAVFRMDLNAPRIVATTTGITGIPLTAINPPRDANNPFGAPYQEEGFGGTLPVFYGDINELNPATLSFTVNETTVDFPIPAAIPGTEPGGAATAVWGSAPAIRWRFDTSAVWTSLAEGAHTFRLEVRDKAGRSAVKQVTFFKDSDGPAINFITINGTSLTDAELDDIQDGGSWTTISAEEKYNEIKGGAVIRETDAKIFGSFVDGYSAVDTNFIYRLDGGVWVAATTSTTGKTANWAIDVSALSDGFHTLDIRAKDSGGNGYDDASADPPNGPGAAVNIGFILDKEYPRLVIVSPYGDKDTDETVYAYRTAGEAPGTTALTVKGLAGDSSLKATDPLVAGFDSDASPNNVHITTQLLKWRGESFIAPDDPAPGQWDAYHNTTDNKYYIHNGTGWDELGPVNPANIYDPAPVEETILWTYTLTVLDLDTAVGGAASTQDGSHKVTFTVREDGASPRTTTKVWNFVRDNAPPNINIISSSPKIQGTVSDSHSDVEELKIKLERNIYSLGWTTEADEPLTINLGGWEKDLTGLPEGQYRITVSAADNARLDADPAGSGNTAVEGPLDFIVDTTNPAIADLPAISFRNGPFALSGTVVDNTAVTISATLNNASINGIPAPTQTGADSYDWSVDVPINGSSAEGSYTVTITATDQANRTNTKIYNFTYDKTPPVVSIAAPGTGALKTSGPLSNNGAWNFYDSEVWINGMVDVRGTSSDTNGIAKISYYLGKLDGLDPGSGGDDETLYNSITETNNPATGWTDTSLHTGSPASGWTGGVYSWTFSENFNAYASVAGKIINNTGGADTATDYYLPLYVKVEDVAGNIRVLHYNLWVDPDLDKPQVSIANPGNNATVGGEVRISGTASDDDWVYGVQIRIRAIYDHDDNDGTPEQSAYYKNPGDSWITSQADGWIWASIVGNTDRVVPWYYIINSDGKLNPGIGDLRQVNIEVRAVDTQDDFHLTPLVEGSSKSIDVQFDSNVPTISNVKISRNGGTPEDLSAGVRAGGTFTISATVRDEGGISSIRARETGDPAYQDMLSSINPKPGVWSVTSPTALPQSSWIPGYKYFITAVGSGTPNWADIDAEYTAEKVYEEKTMFKYKPGTSFSGGSGWFAQQATGTAATTDLANDPNYNTQYFEYTISTTFDSTGTFPYGTTGNYSLELQVTDNNTVPAPYMTMVTYNVLVDNYFPTAEFTTQYNASTKNFYISGTAKDYDSGSGSVQGLERVLVYFQRGTTFMNAAGTTFSGNDPYDQGKEGSSAANSAPTGIANFPVLDPSGGVWKSTNAMVVDRQELGAETDTDGDGTYAEQWEDEGAAKKWQARFDTTVAAMSDGPITIHYVIMDQAGNASHYVQPIYIRNNPPLIRQITLGTDLDGDKSIDAWEEAAPFVVADVTDNGVSGPSPDDVRDIQVSGEIVTNFTARNKMLDFGLYTFGGNGNKHYRVSHVTAGAAVPATGLIAGSVYSIDTAGDTSWTRLGAPNNNTGTVFVATGGGTGSGTAIPYAVVTGTAEKTPAPVSSDTGTVSYGLSDWNNITDSITGDSTTLQHNRLFIVKVYDSTVSTGNETEQSAHAVLVNMDIDNLDETKPVTTVDPFYWNSASDNSLYGNSKNNGHIELEDDLPAAFSGNSGLMDGDPKVSGQISIRGTAKDNGSLQSLWIYLDGFTTGGTTTATINSKLYTQAAEYSGGGTWTGTDRWASNGWKFTVNTGDHVHDQSGHTVSWRLDIDTAKTSGVAAADRIFLILARDGRPVGESGPNTATEDTSQTTAGAPKNYYRMDVVPYISGISTPTRNQGGLKDNNIRSADGKYSVIQGTNTTFITIKGFNLNPQANGVRILTQAQQGTYNPAATGNTGLTAGTALPFSGAASPYTSFSASNNSTHSGYLAVFGGTPAVPIGSLNNINYNDSAGGYDPETPSANGLDQENMPNREADRYITKNITLTDDRYLQFFGVKDTGIKNGYYPDMIMNGNNPVFGYINLSGGPNLAPQRLAGGGAGTLHYQDASPQRTEFSYALDTTRTSTAQYTEYLVKMLSGDQMAMARDDSGRYLHTTVYNYNAGDLMLIYDRYAELYTNQGLGWAAGTTYTDWPASVNNQDGRYRTSDDRNNAISFETVNYGGTLMLDRYLYPKLVVKGNSTTNAGASVYLLYYDDNTTNRNLILRNLRIGTTGANIMRAGNAEASNGGNYAQYVNFNEANSNSAAGLTSGRIPAATNASKYFDMAVTSDNIVVIAYYDEDEGKLKLRYSSAAVSGANPTTDPGWTNSPVDLPPYVGTYVSMVMDAANGIHIAAFDATDSDLKYIYIPNHAATAYTAVTVDQYGAVGNWTQIKLKDNVPYIAYYNATETGGRDTIKLAWAKSAALRLQAGVDDGGYTTGNWEYLTAPAITPPQGGSPKFQKVNLGFTSNADGNRPVLGYLGTNIEFSYPVNE